MPIAPVGGQAGTHTRPFTLFRAIAASTLLFAAALALPGCSKPAGAANAPQAHFPTVTVTAPTSAMVQDSVEYTGRIEPSQRVELRSRVSGYLQAIQFKDGQRVNVGDVLFVVDQRPFTAARDRAQAGLAQANARLKLAGAQAERATRLQAAGANSAEDQDRFNAEHETAKAAALAAEAELRSAELELSFTTIRAPIAGMASDRRVDVGNYVAGGASQGAVLTTIVATSPAHAVVELSEADHARLRRQRMPDTVQVRLDGAAARPGKVDFIDNEASQRSGTVRMRAVVPNADAGVLPGNFVRLSIPMGSAQQRLLVPDTAILSDQTHKLVLVVDGQGQVSAKPVQLGGLEGGQRVVLSGLAANDQVIVSGGQKVRPGARVQVASAAQPA
ncbi:MAG: efflux RND transporter periplasmic adaptor subunit [Burkholderiaceae bacterium]|nr:efflux RND transporter periplasmic adaptor subunit [Burkholderiaceae bacterium]